MFKRFILVGAIAALMAPAFAVAWSVTGNLALLVATLGSMATGLGCGVLAAGVSHEEHEEYASSENASADHDGPEDERREAAPVEASVPMSHDTVFALFRHRADATTAHERLVDAGIERERIDTFGGTSGIHALDRDDTVDAPDTLLVASSGGTPADGVQPRSLVSRLREKGGAVVRVRAGGSAERREAESELRTLQPALLLSGRRAS